jgi:hypothetical protein
MSKRLLVLGLGIVAVGAAAAVTALARSARVRALAEDAAQRGQGLLMMGLFQAGRLLDAADDLAAEWKAHRRTHSSSDGSPMREGGRGGMDGQAH